MLVLLRGLVVCSLAFTRSLRQCTHEGRSLILPLKGSQSSLQRLPQALHPPLPLPLPLPLLLLLLLHRRRLLGLRLVRRLGVGSLPAGGPWVQAGLG